MRNFMRIAVIRWLSVSLCQQSMFSLHTACFEQDYKHYKTTVAFMLPWCWQRAFQKKTDCTCLCKLSVYCFHSCRSIQLNHFLLIFDLPFANKTCIHVFRFKNKQQVVFTSKGSQWVIKLFKCVFINMILIKNNKVTLQ